MYWFILISICSFLFVFWGPVGKSLEKSFPLCAAISAIIFLSGCATLIFLSWLYHSAYPHEAIFQESRRVRIVSLKDISYSSGSFILGTGSFNSSMRYYFMTKNKDDGMNMEYIPSNSTTIYEKDSEPTVIQYDTVFVSPRTKWSLPRFALKETKYDIIVPIGTVVKNLSIDLEGK